MCYCNVVLLSGAYFYSRVLHGMSNVLHWLACFILHLKVPAMFWVLHHYTNNFNIPSSLALFPNLSFPPIFSVYLLILFSSSPLHHPPLVLFHILQPLNHTPVARQFVLCCAEWTLQKAACLLSGRNCLFHTQRVASIQHNGRNYRTQPGGEVNEAEHCSGAFWLHLTS